MSGGSGKMGYLVTTQNPCPNCNNLSALKRVSENGNTLLVCQECGLKLFAEKRTIVLDSYIDKSIIGKPFNIFGKELFDPTNDTEVIAKESILYG